MQELLKLVILDNAVSSYLWVAGIITAMLILKKYLSRYVAGLIFRMVSKWTAHIDRRSFLDLLVAPLQSFLMVLVAVVALSRLNFPKGSYEWIGVSITPDFVIYKTSFHQVLESLGVILVIITFIRLLLRSIDFGALVLERKANLTPDQSDDQLILFFKDFFKVLIAINGLLLILKFGLGLNIGNLVTGLSIVGAAIALATRESLENLIASFIIFFDKPFTTGDLVKVHQITGTVERIGLRSTRIRTEQKTYVTVPNKQMVDSIMDNLSLRSHRRVLLNLEFHSQTPPDAIRNWIRAAKELLAQKPLVETPAVHLTDIQNNACRVTVEFFTPAIPVAAFSDLREEAYLELLTLVEQYKLVLAPRIPETAKNSES